MEPFFSGMAIGIAILIPLVILMFIGRVLFLFGAILYGLFLGISGDVSRRRRARVADSPAASQPQP